MNDLKERQQTKKNKLSKPLDVSKSSENKPASSEGQACKMIENTPFFTGKLSNGRWAIGCNKTRTKKTFATAEEAEAYVKAHKTDWELMGMFIQEMFNQIKNK